MSIERRRKPPLRLETFLPYRLALIANLVSEYAQHDIVLWGALELGPPPWPDADELWRRSPIRYVKNIRTPLLLTCGEMDLRCAISQSEEMFGAMAVLGKTVAVNPFTRIDNGPVANTDHVEVRAVRDRDGNLIATRIVKQSASNKAFLQGPVTAADSIAGTLTILGITVGSNVSTEWRASSTSTEVPVTKAAFFSQISANVTAVKVRWDSFTGLAVPIKEAEIELGK